MRLLIAAGLWCCVAITSSHQFMMSADGAAAEVDLDMTRVDVAALAALRGSALLQALRSHPAAATIHQKRQLTKAVYDVVLKGWKGESRYRNTIARHLVADVHAMFRVGFADIVASSKPGAVSIDAFNRLNSGLLQHHSHEDAMLFPMLQKQFPGTGAEFEILERDHAHLVAVEKSIAKSQGRHEGSFAALVEFTSALEDHLCREEILLVPMLMEARL